MQIELCVLKTFTRFTYRPMVASAWSILDKDTWMPSGWDRDGDMRSEEKARRGNDYVGYSKSGLGARSIQILYDR